MPHPSKRRGDRAELELAKAVADLTGWNVKRALGAGRAEDVGDLFGIPDTTAQAKDWKDVLAAINCGLQDLRRQQANSGDTFGVCFVRRRGGRWVAVMELDQWATYAREAAS
jgi:hypothetical protein